MTNRVPFDMGLIDYNKAWSYVTPRETDYKFFTCANQLLLCSIKDKWSWKTPSLPSLENENEKLDDSFRIIVMDFDNKAVIITKDQFTECALNFLQGKITLEEDILYKTICEMDKDIMFIIFEYDLELKSKYYELFDKLDKEVLNRQREFLTP